jgi:uncharacterized membrane protein YgaE (UPF0421/DUF939 family)
VAPFVILVYRLALFHPPRGPAIAEKTPRRPSRLRRFTALAEHAADRERLLDRLRSGSLHAAIGVAAAIIAYLPPSYLGVPEAFWASITALAVAQSELSAVRSTARDQFVGAAIGGVVGVAVATLLGHGLLAYAIAVTIALLLAWLTNAATAARLAGITATIILLVPHQTSDTEMMLTRLGEVGWGITAALLVATPVSYLRRHLETHHPTVPRPQI